MKNSNAGKFGETLFEIWARQHGWHMERHQPPMKIIAVDYRPIMVPLKSQGVADYTGYSIVTYGKNGLSVPFYRAVEVKEATGDTMPCSRLNKDQREWMSSIDQRCALVAVCWIDGNPTIELFNFKNKGSYRKGKGRNDNQTG